MTTLAEQVTEKQFMETIVRMARLLGWRCFHPYDSRRSAFGYPDLTLIHPTHGALWLELKTERGRIRPQQREWINDMQAAGLNALIVRPSDMDRVESMLRGSLR